MNREETNEPSIKDGGQHLFNPKYPAEGSGEQGTQLKEEGSRLSEDPFMCLVMRWEQSYRYPEVWTFVRAGRGDTYQALVEYDFTCNYMTPPQICRGGSFQQTHAVESFQAGGSCHVYEYEVLNNDQHVIGDSSV